jgi:hypothetical protein
MMVDNKLLHLGINHFAALLVVERDSREPVR